ncbi:CHASE3 domain sensor protein [Treponema rectale]|uniref:CHASE3 domain sensor protein n=1 Tax=Treponema rectale TaxID=744512 RepID=A0A840SJZ9_9SPIR|nr:hypothetical protein [Treponema rectale]MBB5219691.1 CHASE3 domain sensor protein [Treponema rectale]
MVKFCVTNSLVQERLEEIFNKTGIFSDTSFKKNIFAIPTLQFLTLIEKENQTLVTKLRIKKDEFIEKLKKTLKIDSDSKINEIQNLINKNDAQDAIKSACELASKIAGFINIPQNTIAAEWRKARPAAGRQTVTPKPLFLVLYFLQQFCYTETRTGL